MDTYEITYTDNGDTYKWTEDKCKIIFGKSEWNEIKSGYLPHIVAVKISWKGWVNSLKYNFISLYSWQVNYIFKDKKNGR